MSTVKSRSNDKPKQKIFIDGKNDVEQFLKEIGAHSKFSSLLESSSGSDSEIEGVVSLPYITARQYQRDLISNREVYANLNGQITVDDESYDLDVYYKKKAMDVFPPTY